MSLHYLYPNDFVIAKGGRGPILCTQIRGFSFLLFYSDNCAHSRQAFPIFKQLPLAVNNCVFGMHCIDRSREVIDLSRKTIEPITYVPYIALYYDGKPYARYEGPFQIDDMKRFIFDVSKKLNERHNLVVLSKQQSQRQGGVYRDTGSGIPTYTIGKPKVGDDEDDRSYLVFDIKKDGVGGYVTTSKKKYIEHYSKIENNPQQMRTGGR